MKPALKAMTFAALLAVMSCQHMSPRGHAPIWTAEIGSVNLDGKRCSQVFRWIEEKSRTIDPTGIGVIVREGELSGYFFSVLCDLRVDNATLLGVLTCICKTNGLSFRVEGREVTIFLNSQEITTRLRSCESLRGLAEARVYVYGRELEEIDRLLVLNSIEPEDTYLSRPDPEDRPCRPDPIYFVYGNRMSMLFPCEDGWRRDHWGLSENDDLLVPGYHCRTSMIVLDALNLYLGSKYETNSFATVIIKHREETSAARKALMRERK